jgi:hypothetical protein
MKFRIKGVKDKKEFEKFLNEFIEEFPEKWKKTIENSKLTKFAMKVNPALRTLFDTCICNWCSDKENYILTVLLGIENMPNATKTMSKEIPEKIKDKFPDVEIEIEK